MNNNAAALFQYIYIYMHIKPFDKPINDALHAIKKNKMIYCSYKKTDIFPVVVNQFIPFLEHPATRSN
jgi:hypothetical protein